MSNTYNNMTPVSFDCVHSYFVNISYLYSIVSNIKCKINMIKNIHLGGMVLNLERQDNDNSKGKR